MMAPPLRAPTTTPSPIANSHYEEAQAVQQLWHQAGKKTIILQLEL